MASQTPTDRERELTETYAPRDWGIVEIITEGDNEIVVFGHETDSDISVKYDEHGTYPILEMLVGDRVIIQYEFEPDQTEDSLGIASSLMRAYQAGYETPTETN